MSCCTPFGWLAGRWHRSLQSHRRLFDWIFGAPKSKFPWNILSPKPVVQHNFQHQTLSPSGHKKIFWSHQSRLLPQICAGLWNQGPQNGRPGRWPHRSEAEQLGSKVEEDMGWLNPGWVLWDWQLPADQRRKARDKQGGGMACLLSNKPICWKTICFKKMHFSQYVSRRGSLNSQVQGQISPCYSWNCAQLTVGFPKCSRRRSGQRLFWHCPNKLEETGWLTACLQQSNWCSISSH